MKAAIKTAFGQEMSLARDAYKRDQLDEAFRLCTPFLYWLYWGRRLDGCKWREQNLACRAIAARHRIVFHRRTDRAV